MTHVIATLDLESGTRAAYLAEFVAVVPLVRAESGRIDHAPVVGSRESRMLAPV